MDNEKLINLFEMLIDRLNTIEDKLNNMNVYMLNDIRFSDKPFKLIPKKTFNNEMDYDIYNYKFSKNDNAFVIVTLSTKVEIEDDELSKYYEDDLFIKLIKVKQNTLLICFQGDNKMFIDEICIHVSSSIKQLREKYTITKMSVLSLSRYLFEINMFYMKEKDSNKRLEYIKQLSKFLSKIEKKMICDEIINYFENDPYLLPCIEKHNDVEVMLNTLDPFSNLYGFIVGNDLQLDD